MLDHIVFIRVQEEKVMRKLLPALLLCAACSNANASDWGWGTYSDTSSTDFCVGFVVGGLSSYDVSGMSRTELWQAWSYLIRSGAMSEIDIDNDFKVGKAKFDNAPDASAAAIVLEDQQGDCGLGRSGHQITGW